LASASFDAIAAAVDRLGPRPHVSDLPPAAILAALQRDKKAQGGKVPFVLPKAVGRVVIEPQVEPALIRHALRVMAAQEARA
jgi:3-dehydroquinate synthetase